MSNDKSSKAIQKNSSKMFYFKIALSKNAFQDFYFKNSFQNFYFISIVFEGIRTLIFFTENSKKKKNPNSTLNKPKTS